MPSSKDNFPSDTARPYQEFSKLVIVVWASGRTKSNSNLVFEDNNHEETFQYFCDGAIMHATAY